MEEKQREETNAGELSQQNLPELRERFVRQRLLQEFGRSDINEWISAQQKADIPSEEWDRYVKKMAQYFHGLSRDEQPHIVAISRKSLDDCFGDIPESHKKIITSVVEPLYGGKEYFRQESSGYPLVHFSCGLHVIKVEEVSSCQNRLRVVMEPVGKEYLIGDMIESWRRMADWGNHPSFHRSDLCGLMQRTIDAEKRKAEADFDAAVAVSVEPDGTVKIVGCNYVVILHDIPEKFHDESRGPYTIIPSEAFRDEKIVCRRLNRKKIESSRDIFQAIRYVVFGRRYCWQWKYSKVDQFFVETSGSDGKRFFVTHEGNCPERFRKPLK